MTLYTAPGTGGLSFITNPPGAIILLDELEYPIKTPAAINNIPPGTHPFVLKMEGYNDYTDVAEVIETRLCCIDTDLMTAQAKKICNPTQLEISPVPTPVGVPSPDYKMLIIGLLAGVVIGLLIDKICKRT